jgi:hypothetical protein
VLDHVHTEKFHVVDTQDGLGREERRKKSETKTDDAMARPAPVVSCGALVENERNGHHDNGNHAEVPLIEMGPRKGPRRDHHAPQFTGSLRSFLREIGRLARVKSRWFSPRALLLHLALVLWVAGCVTAAVWQVGRAFQGNTLSYMYSVEWPVFAILGIFGWWSLVHLDGVSEEQRATRKAYEDKMRADALAARQRSVEPEDATLAAYNDHLATISRQPKKRLWGH